MSERYGWIRSKVCEEFAEKQKQELIEEFLPHLEWALNELYNTHYNNEKFRIHNNYYIKLKKRLKQ